MTLALVLGLALPALAAAGDLDPTFGKAGKVTTFVGPTPGEANAVAIQSDGKIVTAGGTDVDGNQSDFVLTRYNPDGSLDASFSGDGIVTTSFTPNDDHAFDVAIQTDGKIVAVGYSGSGTANFNDTKLTLARYNTDGTLDPTFGSGGIVRTDVGPCDDYGNAVAMQTDGKIVVSGASFFGANCDNATFTVARYNPDGTLDPTFGRGGTVTTDFTAGRDFSWSVALQSDGKIVLGGVAGCCDNATFGLARYNTDGSLDSTFGKRGKVTTDFTPFVDWGNELAIQADGKIVEAGFSGVGGGNGAFALARYNTNGSLDTTFGKRGKLTTDFTAFDDQAIGVAIQSDGKLVAAGTSNQGCCADTQFALARYNTNGTLDTTFGSGGKLTTNFAAFDDVGSDVAIQADGKIVVAGVSFNAAHNHSAVALARYLPS